MINILGKLAVSLTTLTILLGAYLVGINSGIKDSDNITLGGSGPDLYKVSSSSAMTITTTSRQIVGTTSHRAYAVITNEGTNPVYLQFGDKTAVAYEGLRLNPAGGAFEITNENLYKGVIKAVTASGNSTTTFFEAY